LTGSEVYAWLWCSLGQRCSPGADQLRQQPKIRAKIRSAASILPLWHLSQASSVESNVHLCKQTVRGSHEQQPQVFWRGASVRTHNQGATIIFLPSMLTFTGGPIHLLGM